VASFNFDHPVLTIVDKTSTVGLLSTFCYQVSSNVNTKYRRHSDLAGSDWYWYNRFYVRLSIFFIRTVPAVRARYRWQLRSTRSAWKCR